MTMEEEPSRLPIVLPVWSPMSAGATAAELPL